MSRVRIAAYNLHVRPDAFCRAVAALLGIGRSAIYLLQLSVVNITAKRIFNRLQVRLVAVSGQLHLSTDAIRAVLHEVVRQLPNLYFRILTRVLQQRPNNIRSLLTLYGDEIHNE